MNKITKASVYTIQECAAEGRSICIFFMIVKHMNAKNRSNKDESFRVLGGFSLKLLSNYIKRYQMKENDHP
jgi:hypothetical protein